MKPPVITPTSRDWRVRWGRAGQAKLPFTAFWLQTHRPECRGRKNQRRGGACTWGVAAGAPRAESSWQKDPRGVGIPLQLPTLLPPWGSGPVTLCNGDTPRPCPDKPLLKCYFRLKLCSRTRFLC